jgi:hypothetical protein
MDITWKLGTSKTGQGFGSATTQFMDLFIKFDVAAGNGYALRIQRTSRQNLGTEWGIVEYKGWNAYTVPLYPQPKAEDFEDAPPAAGTPKRWNSLWWDTRPRTSAFQTFSTIRIRTEGTRIIVDGETDAPQSANHIAQNLAPSVHLEYDGYAPNTYGGFGIWQNGTSNFEMIQGGSDATTSLRGLDVIWK